MTALRAVPRVGTPATAVRPRSYGYLALALATLTVASLLAAWLHSIGVIALAPAATAYRASLLAAGGTVEALSFDIAPLPILLALPFAGLPAFEWTTLGPAIVAGLAASLTAWSLAGALSADGLRPRVALAVAAFVSVQPLWIFAAATGSGQIVAAALLVTGARGLLAWLRTRDELALAASSFAVGGAAVARYDAVLSGIALAVVIGLLAARDGHLVRARALAIGYVTPVLGALGLWLVVVTLATGDPLGLISRAHSAVALAPDATWSLAEPLLALAALIIAAAAVALARDRATVVLATLIAGVAVPPVLFGVATGVPATLDDLVPAVPLIALLAARPSRARALVAPLALGLAVAAVAGVGLAEDRALGHREAIRAATGSETLMWAGERDIASAVRSTTGTVLLDDRVDVIAALLIGDAARVLGSGHPRWVEAVKDPAETVDLVLVRTPSGRATAHAVAGALPTLYEGGLGWDLVADRPVSGEAARYRLYRTEGRGSR